MRVRHRLAGIVAAVVLAGAGCGHGQETPKSSPPTAVLDGTYRLDQDGAKVTTNGAPSPVSNATFWYAFRSSCGSTGCAATGTRLDDNNHQVAFTPATTTVMHFVGGR
jgi:serine/threonine protein kinase, bacterial